MADLVVRSSSSVWPELRRLWRLLRVITHIFYGLLQTLWLMAWWRPYSPAVRTATQRWLQQLLAMLAVQIEVRGQPLTGPVFLVSNHVSWLDIPLIGVQRPLSFLSKEEVRDWPLIGLLAQAIGTLFIRRGSGDSQRKAEEIAGHLAGGHAVLVFPEGTTTDGHAVKRFFPQLFAAPLLAAVPVQPMALRYLDEHGQPDQQLAFVGDDEFHHHLWHLLLRDRIDVRLCWGEPLPASPDRDLLARRAHAAVTSLLNG
jgi:lyso-ornithine lipid O-acyltransferase